MLLPINWTSKIKPSNISGLGVFATQDIKTNTIVCTYNGEKMLKSDFKEKYGNDTKFVYQTPNFCKHLYHCKNKRNLVSYVNCGHYGQSNPDHNCTLKKRKLIAIKDINKGSELLLKYKKNYKYN
jgi:SET domain-containing protein